jgi:hypothetical protein
MVKRSIFLILFILVGSKLLPLLHPNATDIAAQIATELPPFPTATPSATITPLPAFPTATPSPAYTTTPYPTHSPEDKVVQMTCLAEPKWSFLIDIFRGPDSEKWGVIRQLAHNKENYEMRVIGRDQSTLWYHVVLPPPYETQVGWVWYQSINVFGKCDHLPTTDAKPEITINEVPPPPEPIPLPEFARSYVTLTPYDRAFLVKPGILYIRREVPGEDQKERIQAHIMLMDLHSPQLRVGVTVGAIPGVGGVPVSKMGRDTGAFIAITGDYYAGNYFPQGMTVIDGQVVTAPKKRAAFGITRDRQPFIGYFTTEWTWGAYVVATNGETIPLQLVNVPCELLWLCLYTHHRAGRLPGGEGDVRVLLDNEYRVVEIVENRTVEIPEGYFLLRGGLATGNWLKQNVHIGDQLQLVLPTTPDWRNFESIISGGPRLLADGKFWEDCYPTPGDFCEEFDFEFRDSHYGLKSLPRTAVGYNAAGDILYAIVVEGYEVEDSGGMTRQELANLFLEFGAVNAMEFDGGGSASMFMQPNGTISDHGYEGERRVSNALLFFWDD